jgi:hypothetical protein
MKAVIQTKNHEDWLHTVLHFQVGSAHSDNYGADFPLYPQHTGMIARACEKHGINLKADMSVEITEDLMKQGKIIVHYTGNNPNIFCQFTNTIMHGILFGENIVERVQSMEISFD